MTLIQKLQESKCQLVINVQGGTSAPVVMTRLKLFIPTLKAEFFLKQNDQLLEDPFEYDGSTYARTDELSHDVPDNLQKAPDGKLV